MRAAVMVSQPRHMEVTCPVCGTEHVRVNGSGGVTVLGDHCVSGHQVPLPGGMLAAARWPHLARGAAVRPLVLDLGCGIGGVSKGYHDAGFETVGVDIEPQPHYPYTFIQAGMEDFMDRLLAGEPGTGFALEALSFIHLSAPCQRWSKMTRCRPGLAETYPDLITPMRPRLEVSGLPYVIENVEGAPLRDPIRLCTWTFGREMYRHRYVEAGGGLVLTEPLHRVHETPASKAGHWVPGTFFSMAGHVAPMWKAREVMGISWGTREELAEAVPPYLFEYVGLQVRQQLLAAA